MTEQDELRRKIVEALAVAQSDAEVADMLTGSN